MTTATGDVARDYAAASDVSPLTDASFTYLDPGDPYRLQVLSNRVKPVSTSDFQPMWRYNGAMGSGIIRAKMEIGTNNSGDYFCCYIVNTSATGYVLRVTNTTGNIYPVTAGAIQTGSAIGSAGTFTGASGSVIALVYDPSTDTLSATQNGSTISGPGGVDSTTTTGLSFAFGIAVENNNGSDFISIAGDGIASVDTLMAQICM